MAIRFVEREPERTDAVPEEPVESTGPADVDPVVAAPPKKRRTRVVAPPAEVASAPVADGSDAERRGDAVGPDLLPGIDKPARVRKPRRSRMMGFG